MVKRGGGVVDFVLRKVPRSETKSEISSYWLVAHFHIDVCDSMGANCATSVAEGVAPLLQQISGARIGLRIVSNLAAERLSKASFRLPVSGLVYKNIPGADVAARIVEAYQWALDDPYRAVTHNKVA